MRIRKAAVFVAVLFVGLFLFVGSSLAAVLKNNTNRRIIITLANGQTCMIAAQRTVTVSQQDMTMANIVRLIRNGSLAVIQQSTRPR